MIPRIFGAKTQHRPISLLKTTTVEIESFCPTLKSALRQAVV